MAVPEIITDIRAWEDLEIRCVAFVGNRCVRVLYGAGVVLVERLQMSHIILSTEPYLNG